MGTEPNIFSHLCSALPVHTTIPNTIPPLPGGPGSLAPPAGLAAPSPPALALLLADGQEGGEVGGQEGGEGGEVGGQEGGDVGGQGGQGRRASLEDHC